MFQQNFECFAFTCACTNNKLFCPTIHLSFALFHQPLLSPLPPNWWLCHKQDNDGAAEPIRWEDICLGRPTPRFVLVVPLLIVLVIVKIRIVVREKNGIMWEKFLNWGGGLTQTHFLMSTYQVIFGMPKWFWGAKTCFTKRGVVISDQFEHLTMFSFWGKWRKRASRRGGSPIPTT